MSMFALYKNIDQPSRVDVERGLAGNLCRCTGYRPIIDAALSLAGKGVTDQFSQAEASVYQQLRDIEETLPTAELSFSNRRFFVPCNSDELADLLQRYPEAQMVAGGTDLALAVTQQLQQPDILIYLGRVATVAVLRGAQRSLSAWRWGDLQ